ncbi:MAG: 4-phosphoerythronate dehydrogenase [Nitrospirota bacterium]|nr:MAG: 4-phosphoerythronate dehydrogenase [Nitrospirota bacterium]
MSCHDMHRYTNEDVVNPYDLNIIADENIPFVQEAFGTVGTVKLVPGRALSPSFVRDAQVLLVRSVTQVNRELLGGSPVQFVGTATAGLDHIDSEYLQTNGIAFASAQGGNANSVAEYVVTALLSIARRQGLSLAGQTIGIVGVGNIGQLVKVKAEGLGMSVVLNDPPLAQETGDKTFRPLKEVLDCDVVTLHVPLTYEGPFKTFHFFNDATLAKLKPSAVFLNTSRGEVVDTRPLLNRLQKNTVGSTVLDVWESEPDINWELFKMVTLGTPHIAGYSLDGKAEGTLFIYQALCNHLGLTPSWNLTDSLPAPAVPHINLDPREKPDEQILSELIEAIYNIEADHARMAALRQIPHENRPLAFDRLRKNYPVRREFHHTTVRLLNGETEIQQKVASLGFKIER